MTQAPLYHYTTPSGFLGIISNSCIWLSDVEFMNDAEEIRYPMRTVVAELRKRVESCTDGPEDGYRTAEGARAFVLNTIANELERTSDPDRWRTWHAYAACFCENGDLLSQWRGYGDTAGFSIGFKPEVLEAAVAGVTGGQLVKVNYGVSNARSQIDAMLEEITPSMQVPHPNSRANIYLMTRVLPALLAVKDPAFSEEREWRLSGTSWGIAEPAKFRAGSFGITPYVEVELDLKEAIVEVIVGPGNHADVRTAGVRQLLEHNDLSGVTVKPSSIPFRS